MNKISALLACAALLFAGSVQGQTQQINDYNTALHLLQAGYRNPYGVSKVEDIKATMDRILVYLDQQTPPQLLDRNTNQPITDFSNSRRGFHWPGDSGSTATWGVDLRAMLAAGEATGDARYTNYTKDRFSFIAQAVAPYREAMKTNPSLRSPFNSVLNPGALDDAGAMCVAMIQASLSGANQNLRPMIDNYVNYIMNKEYRLADGTLARNRPRRLGVADECIRGHTPANRLYGALTKTRSIYDKLSGKLIFLQPKFRAGERPVQARMD
jgi:hypothetical protein